MLCEPALDNMHNVFENCTINSFFGGQVIARSLPIPEDPGYNRQPLFNIFTVKTVIFTINCIKKTKMINQVHLYSVQQSEFCVI